MSAKPSPRWMVRCNAALLRRGLAVGSQWLLTVPGRRSGQPRSTPVSIATVAGDRYIVAAFADAAWVANVRAAGVGTVARGSRVEAIMLSELPVAARGPVLVGFLEQVPGGTRFFDGRTPAEVVEAADRYPVFLVSPAPDRAGHV